MDKLPTDLLRVVTEDYLDLNSVVCLDSALCCHGQREIWQKEVLRNLTIAGTEGDVSNNLHECLLWLSIRQVVVAPLFVNPLQLIAAAVKPSTRAGRKNSKPHPLKIQSIAFVGQDVERELCSDKLLAFLRRFPQLTAVDFSRWTNGCTDEHLMELRALRCQLQSLSLPKDRFVHAITVMGILTSIGTTLRAFEGSADEPVLKQLLTLNNMRALKLRVCIRKSLTSIAVELLRKNVATLEIAELRSFRHHDDRVKNTQLFDAIQACTGVKSFATPVPDVLKTLQNVLDHGHVDGSMELDDGNMTVVTAKNAHGLLLCDVEVIHDRGDVSGFKGFLKYVRNLPLPIRKLVYDEEPLSEKQISWLAAHGQYMEHLTLDVSALSNDKMLHYLAQFPNLKEFVTTNNNFTNAVFPLLPKVLPMVTVLDICREKISDICDINDASFVTMIEGFKHNNLRSLSMNTCDDITDVSLLKVLQCCPRIHTLQLYNSMFYRKTVLDLIMSRKLKVRKLCIDKADHDWIMNRLKLAHFRRIPEFRIWNNAPTYDYLSWYS